MPVRTVPPEIEKELTIRLYHWALQDSERGIANGFPLLRTIENAQASGFVAYCQTLSAPDLLSIGRSRVRLAHPIALAYLNEIITPEEQHLIEESCKTQRLYNSVYTQSHNIPFSSDSAFSTKAGVTALLKEAMRPAFGERQPSRFKVVSTYETDFPQKSTLWRLQTRIVALHKHPNMGYTQSLYLPEHEWALASRHPSHRATDILGWLGITPQPTYWDIPLKSDVEPAVASLALVTKHYLDAIPSIIEGLSL